jgi:hypothetical protein
MPNKPVLSIVIPSCNGYQLLKQSLPLLSQSLAYAKINSYEIIIVNNGSFDRTSDFLKSQPKTITLEYKKPLGFAKATNIGIKKASGNYLLLLNNDCLVERNTVKELINFLEENKQYAFTQPIVKEAGKNTVGYKVDLRIAKAFPIVINTVIKKQARSNRKRHSGFLQNLTFSSEYIQDSGQARMTTKIGAGSIFKKHYLFGLSAACLLIRKDVFDQIGLFDESFGSYLEDIDFCFRAINKGVRFIPCLATTVDHLHLQTSAKMGSYKAKKDFINWIRIIFKHYPKKYILMNLIPLFIERLRNFWGIIKLLMNYRGLKGLGFLN